MYLAKNLCRIADKANEAWLVRDHSDEKKLNAFEYKEKFQQIEDWLLSMQPAMREAADKGNYWIKVEHEVVKNLFEHLELFLSVIYKHGFRVAGFIEDRNQVTIAWSNWLW